MHDSLRGAWGSWLCGAGFLVNSTVYVLTCVPFLAISTNVLTSRVSSLSPISVFLANVTTILVVILISYFLRLKLLIRRANLQLVLTKIGFVFSVIIPGSFGFVRGVKKKVEATLMIEVASTFRF